MYCIRATRPSSTCSSGLRRENSAIASRAWARKTSSVWSRRKLLPALYNLAHEGALPERFNLIGISRSDKPHEDYRAEAREWIKRFSRTEPDERVLDGLLENVRYLPGTFDDPDVYERLEKTPACSSNSAAVFSSRS